MKIMNEAVFRFLNRKPAKWTLSGGMNLNGLIALFRATGDQDCRRAILGYMESSVSPEGTIFCTSACTPADLAACGKALFFALDESGDERYRKALDAVADGVKDKPLPNTPAELYAVAPFLAEYDTRFGGKQTYKAIAEHFKAVHQGQFDPETSLYRTENSKLSLADEGLKLMALADTAEKLDMQIYEHYRTLADLLLEAARGLAPKKTFASLLLPRGSAEEQRDVSGRVLIAAALFKGVRLHLLNEEKYLPLAALLRSSVTADYIFGFPCDPGPWMLLQAETEEVERS